MGGQSSEPVPGAQEVGTADVDDTAVTKLRGAKQCAAGHTRGSDTEARIQVINTHQGRAVPRQGAGPRWGDTRLGWCRGGWCLTLNPSTSGGSCAACTWRAAR